MLDDAALNDFLRCYPIFHNVPAHLQRHIQESGSQINYLDGQVVFDLDDFCSGFAMPLSGAIRVVKPSESGREIRLYRLEPGDSCIITASCLLGDNDYMACGIAEGCLQAVAIPKWLFLQLIEQAPPFRTFVFQSFGQRLTQLTLLIEEIAFHKLDQRLAALLLARGPAIQSTHQMLANELGSVREVVSRLLLDLKEQGAIDLERGCIYILDETILAKIAEPLS